MVRKNVSLANQLVFEILALIDSGEILSDGQVLPSEADLSQRFGVSRATVREALAKLELGGAIIRRHGVGTYVSPMVTSHLGSVRNWLDEAPSFIDLIESEGYRADCTLVDIRIIPAGALAQPLDLLPATPLVAISRIFRATNIPAIHSANFVSFDLVEPELRPALLSAYTCSQTIYEFLQQWCKRKVYNQKSEIRAVAADDRLADLLDSSPGAPLLCVEEVGYGATMKPLFYGLNHFRADLVSFIEMHHPTVWLRPPPQAAAEKATRPEDHFLSR